MSWHMTRFGRNFSKGKRVRLFFLALLFTSSRLLLAQCEYTGLVVDVSDYSPCSLAICSPEFPVLELLDNPYGLEAGDLIHFSYDTLPMSVCGLGLPVSLSCVFVESNTGNGTFCNALFSALLLDPIDPDKWIFQPFVPAPLGLDYVWDFGDGNTSTETSPTHTYGAAGNYTVCLTMTTALGCTDTYCATLIVGDPPSYCDFGVNVSVDGLDLTAEVYNMTDFGPYYPQIVEWINGNSSEVLGTSPILEFTLPDSSYIDELCVVYQVEYPDGTICEGDWCGSIWGDTVCVDSSLIQPGIICPNVFLPVCGCDGVTYANACEAEYHNGVSSWTPGPCSGNYGECIAYYSYTASSDSSFLFYNTSIGDFDNFQWILDGVALTYSWNPCLMTIPEEGYHTVCVKIWDSSTGCTSTYCQEIYSGDPNYQCDYTDCVWPGDANNDFSANVYDLLNIGLSYGAIGVSRPDAHLDWEGQPAPSWGMIAMAGVDFKHMDCDGDGQVLYDDLDAIELNYTSGYPPAPMPEAGGIPIYFEFDQDTIYVDENTPEFLPISGGLYIGSPTQPAVDLHGLGISLVYPQQDLLLPYSTTAEYLDNSFFGASNQSLWMHRDLYDEKKIDLGFTRKADNGANGYGPVANVGFIIISDIIGGRTEAYIPFELIIDGLQLIDGDGVPLPYDLPVLIDSVVIVNKFPATSVSEGSLEKQVRIFPNPAKDRVWAEWDELDVESVILLNAFGQQLRQFAPGHGRQEWSLKGLASGLYTVQFKTSEGIINKKLLVH